MLLLQFKMAIVVMGRHRYVSDDDIVKIEDFQLATGKNPTFLDS